MTRILVIDDDATVTSTLQRGLAFEGFTVATASTGPQGLTAARDRAPDAVILDVEVPGLDGFSVLERMRAADEQLPVLVLTARTDPADQVRALDTGADDYVVKPFSFEVLTARLRSLLRRRERSAPEVLRFSDLTLDTGSRRARRGTRDIELTATEYEVLRQLMLHPRRVLPKHFLMDRVWGYDVAIGSNVLEVYIKQLRRKLAAGGETRLIHTFRGAGYVLREP